MNINPLGNKSFEILQPKIEDYVTDQEFSELVEAFLNSDIEFPFGPKMVDGLLDRLTGPGRLSIVQKIVDNMKQRINVWASTKEFTEYMRPLIQDYVERKGFIVVPLVDFQASAPVESKSENSKTTTPDAPQDGAQDSKSIEGSSQEVHVHRVFFGEGAHPTIHLTPSPSEVRFYWTDPDQELQLIVKTGPKAGPVRFETINGQPSPLIPNTVNLLAFKSVEANGKLLTVFTGSVLDFK